MYIHPDDVSKIPLITRFNYNGETSIFFTTADNLACFLCKQEGHIARVWPNQQKNLHSAEVSNTDIHDATNVPMETELLTNKRAHSQISSESEKTQFNSEKTNMPPPINTQVKKKSRTKKANKNEERPIDELLEPIKVDLNTPGSLMNYETFKNFLQSIKNNDTKEVASRYSNDLSKICDMLTNLYPKLNERCIKSRFTRIKKKLAGLHDDNKNGEISSENTETDEILSEEESDSI